MNAAAAHPPLHAHPEPTRWTALVFLAKAKAHQLRRGVRNWREGIRRHARTDTMAALPIVAQWQSDLRHAEHASARERDLQEGKVQNLRVAAAVLNGVEVPAGQVWSFWRHLGRVTRRKGYAEGRELREGCLIPQIGGGLCQLSGAIYNAALEAGLDVVERHAHTNSAVGSLARIGRDATVFWNYVDLRLRARLPWRMEISVTDTQLQVHIRCAEKLPRGPIAPAEPSPATPLNSCATCGVGTCFRSE
ncbi:MAG: VanW family protein [Prosthecobacter sp.]